MTVRRRWGISLAGITVAATPALVAFTASGPAAPAAAEAATTAAVHSSASDAGHVTVTHGPAIRNGGVGVHIVSRPGTRPLSEHGGIAREEESTNWSGYAADSGTYSSVSASWVQPAVSCSSGSQYAAFWVGLDGYSSSTVEQTGTDSDCDNGSPSYYGWYETYPNPSYNFGDTVEPGDTIDASVTYEGDNNFLYTLADETQGWSVNTNQTEDDAALSSAEVIIEAPSSDSGVLPLADFGTVNLSDALVDGSDIGSDNPAQIVIADSSGNLEDTVSSLSSNGENFSATWESSS
jgi:hypothetical protein